MEQAKIQQLTLWYGYFGLIPFIGIALLIALGLAPAMELRWLYDSYSTMVLAFMAGIYWPMALREHGPACPARLMRASILLALWAWAALMLPDMLRCLAFIAGFLVLFGIDRYVLDDLWSQAYLRMRLHLTLVVVSTQLLMLVAG